MAKPTYEEMQECVIAFEKAVLHQHRVRPHTSRVLVNQRYVLMGMISELCGPQHHLRVESRNAHANLTRFCLEQI